MLFAEMTPIQQAVYTAFLRNRTVASMNVQQVTRAACIGTNSAARGLEELHRAGELGITTGAKGGARYWLPRDPGQPCRRTH